MVSKNKDFTINNKGLIVYCIVAIKKKYYKMFVGSTVIKGNDCLELQRGQEF